MTKDRISKLEDRAIEFPNLNNRQKNKLEKKEKRKYFQGPWDKKKRINVYIFWVPIKTKQKFESIQKQHTTYLGNIIWEW